MKTSKEHKGWKVHWEPTKQTKAAFYIRSRAEYSRKTFSKAYLDYYEGSFINFNSFQYLFVHSFLYVSVTFTQISAAAETHFHGYWTWTSFVNLNDPIDFSEEKILNFLLLTNNCEKLGPVDE